MIYHFSQICGIAGLSWVYFLLVLLGVIHVAEIICQLRLEKLRWLHSDVRGLGAICSAKLSLHMFCLHSVIYTELPFTIIEVYQESEGRRCETF